MATCFDSLSATLGHLNLLLWPNSYHGLKMTHNDSKTVFSIALSPSVIPISNYVITVSDWNCFKYVLLRVIFTIIIRCTKYFWSFCIVVLLLYKLQHKQLTLTACSIHWSHTESAAGFIVVSGCKDYNGLTGEQWHSLAKAAEIHLHEEVRGAMAGLILERGHVRCKWG
jgi:hypothetical protein